MDFIGDIDLIGLLSVVIFYLLILGVGMWAAGKKSNVEGVSEEVTRLTNTGFVNLLRVKQLGQLAPFGFRIILNTSCPFLLSDEILTSFLIQ
jgi:hypothetical protein